MVVQRSSRRGKLHHTTGRITPLILVILDGWGIGETWGGNAIAVANTPNMDRYWSQYGHTQLQAAGEAVGVLDGEAGSSEVGHMNIGAGYVVKQQLTIIKQNIESSEFFTNPTLHKISQHISHSHGKLHIIGLASEGGVHSHLDHLFALLDYCEVAGIKDVYLHLFSDGRDADIMSVEYFVEKINAKITDLGIGTIASISGRYWAMDRDLHWERTEKVYNLLTLGEGLEARDSQAAIYAAYRKGVTDEFILPTKITDHFMPVTDNDVVLFFNFRPDRARQLTEAFVEPSFHAFVRKKVLHNFIFATFVQYKEGLATLPVFPTVIVKEPLGKVLADHHLKQFRIAETEKYPHVTYFLNGGREEPFPGEDRIMVPSPKVKTYDLQPQMSADEITATIIRQYQRHHYDVIVVNFANADMVGHTGNIEATIKGVETIDANLGKLEKAFVVRQHGVMLITADHGNAEQEVNPVTTKQDTEHTSNLVPFIIIRQGVSYNLKPLGSLSNIAPTVLALLGIRPPAAMKQHSLIIKTPKLHLAVKK